MRRISGLVLAASLLLPVSLARAAEVVQLYSNNLFASANSTDATGTTTSVNVTREKGKGEFLDSVNVMVSGPNGFSFIQGTLPKNALHITANSASLEVDLSEIAVTDSLDFPAEGEVSVQWQATGVTRTSGDTKFQAGNLTANIVGTSTFANAIITGSAVGTTLVNPVGFLALAHT